LRTARQEFDVRLAGVKGTDHDRPFSFHHYASNSLRSRRATRWRREQVLAGSVSKPVRTMLNSAKKFEENRGYLPDVDLDGLPIDPRHPANAPRRFWA
jgi:hypothetical protein